MMDQTTQTKGVLERAIDVLAQEEQEKLGSNPDSTMLDLCREIMGETDEEIIKTTIATSILVSGSRPELFVRGIQLGRAIVKLEAEDGQDG